MVSLPRVRKADLLQKKLPLNFFTCRDRTLQRKKKPIWPKYLLDRKTKNEPWERVKSVGATPWAVEEKSLEGKDILPWWETQTNEGDDLAAAEDCPKTDPSNVLIGGIYHDGSRGFILCIRKNVLRPQ